MPRIKDMNDIDDAKRKEFREKIKKDIEEDITGIFENVYTNIEDFFRRKEIQKAKKERGRYMFRSLGRWIWIIISILFTITLLLGCIWVLKLLIKAIF